MWERKDKRWLELMKQITDDLNELNACYDAKKEEAMK